MADIVLNMIVLKRLRFVVGTGASKFQREFNDIRYTENSENKCEGFRHFNGSEYEFFGTIFFNGAIVEYFY